MGLLFPGDRADLRSGRGEEDCAHCVYLDAGDRKGSKCFCKKQKRYVDPDARCMYQVGNER